MILRLAAASLAVLAAPAFAQTLPPADGLPLSRIVAAIEADETLGAILEVEWEDDGYWEFELLQAADGARLEIRIDPHSGAELRRRLD